MSWGPTGVPAPPPSNSCRLPSVGRLLAFDRQRALRAGRDALGRQWRRVELQQRRPAGVPHLQHAEHGREDHAHRPETGRACPSHPFCAADNELSHVCTKIWAGGFRNPFRFKLRPGGGLTVGDVGWGTTEEIDLVPTAAGRRPALWLALLRGQRANRRLPGPRGRLRPRIREGGHGSGPPSGRFTSTRTTARAARWWADRPTPQIRFPASYRGDIFFGDYAQGFIRTLELNAARTRSRASTPSRPAGPAWTRADPGR